MKLKNYFLQMGLSLFLMLCVGIFFFSSIKAIFLSNPKLNTLIISLTLAGVGYAFYQLSRLKSDCEVLEDLTQGQWSFSTLHRTTFLEPILSYITQKKSNLNFSFAKGLTDSLADRLDNERVFPRYLIGLLVFLGLLGTFWGLSQTITSIAYLIQNMPSDSTNSADFFNLLKESLQDPLKGMGTAFSSSLFGLGGSLFVGFLELQVGHAYSRFLNETDLYLTTSFHQNDKGIALASAPSSFLQALLTRNIESIDQLIPIVEKSEKNERYTGQLLDKLTATLSQLAEQNKTHQTLMMKLAEGQIHLQSKLSTLPSGLDEESRSSLQNIDLTLAQSCRNQREEREEFLKRLRDEMRILSKTIANLSDEKRLVG
jgi:hypothetical protein